MDTTPPKLNTYTRVVPLRGSKLQKLKNAFKQEFGNGRKHIQTEDSVKVDAVIKIEPLQEENEQTKVPDSKIIIQKVEKVTYDVSSILFSPGGSKNVCTEASCSSAHIEQDDATPQKSVEISLDSKEMPDEPTTVSLLTSTIPENVLENKVPPKMVRATKPPKPKPNLPKRVHRIQTFRPSQVPPAKTPQPEEKKESEGPTIIIIKKEEPIAKKIIINSVKSDTESSDCCGFATDSDELSIIKRYEFLKLEKTVESGVSTSEIKAEEKPTPVVTIESPPIPELPAKRNARKSIVHQEKKIVEKPKPRVAPKVKSPEMAPEILTKPSKVVTKPSEVVPKPTVPVTKPHEAVAKPPVKIPAKSESNSWQNDILAVIGISRLKEIDEMLRNIPNMIDGNFNPIEMENVELKLIIKHLLRKLKVESITDTLSPGDTKPKVFSEESSNDEDGSFPGGSSFDEDHPDFFSGSTDGDSSAFEDDRVRNDNQPGPSRQASQVIGARKISKSPALSQKEVMVELEDVLTSPKPGETMDNKRKRSLDGRGSPPTKKLKKSRRPSITAITDRRQSLRSSSCDSGNEVKGEKRPVKAVKLVELAKAPSERKRTLRSSSQDSVASVVKIEKKSPKKAVVVRELRNRSKTPVKAGTAKRVSRVEELRSSDSEGGPRRPRSTRKARIASSSGNSDSGSQKKSAASTSSDLKVKAAKSLAKSRTSKAIDSDSDSESIFDDASRKAELKSRLNPRLDSNSTRKSSIFIRNDYLKNSSDKQSKFSADFSRMVQKLSTTVEATKVNDPTYVAPPKIKKRERLRTSAFKGNDDFLSDSDTQDHSTVVNTRPPSVSRDSSDDESFRPKPRNSRNQKFAKLHTVPKKEFVQETVEPADEKKVPYAALLEVIRTSLPNKKLGRVTTSTKEEMERKRKENLATLQSLSHLVCGACTFKVTKHMWVEHYCSHGGLAWIDGFEPPLNMSDWNDLLRRSINAFRIFELPIVICPNCGFERKSALGHMSHMLACGENQEEIEKRKQPCELCGEKFFPFNATYHKKMCKKIEVQPLENNDGDDEVESEGEDGRTKSFNGRLKRKATRKAEKNFKKILKTEKPADYLKEVDGQFSCKVCSEMLESRDDGFDHVKNSHDVVLIDQDFEGSDSDAQISHGDSSETEGSSGVGSSEPESAGEEQNFEGDSNDENNVSSKKARASNYESQEVKNARAVGTEYFDSLRDSRLPMKIYGWTKNFFDTHWKAEVLPGILPLLGSNLNKSAKIALALLNYDQFSMKFGGRQLERYPLTYEHKFDKDWTRLEIGEDVSDKSSSVIFCGGSVSSVDWAPGTEDLDFLAVACNIPTQKLTLNITETTKSCVQLYEFKNLTNEKFAGFKDTARLCYAVIVNDGPILSLRFHPSKCDIEKRVGILAVATANASVFIYSLPYLSDVKSVILPIKPNMICKLEMDDVFFNSEYLLQVSKVAWYQKSGTDSILAAGFISGCVALWNVSEGTDGTTKVLFPRHVLHQHLEPISALDFKATTGDEYHLMTASRDRKIKVFTFDECGCQEIASNYAVSRIFCAEWWMNWPGFLIGFDDCYSQTHFFYRQPLEFACRNESLMTMHSSIIDLSINHWTNQAIIITDAGDVLACAPRQLMQNYSKDKWAHYNFSLVSSTDFNKITADENENEEIAVVFGDFKANTPPAKNKKWRLAPTDRIDELQINQVCFNRNEKSHRFFALGYKTGFLRIKYLKNSN